MQSNTPAGLDAEVARLCRVVKALSHEHRLFIVSLLCVRERSVGELERVLRQPQPAVSQHLARLRKDGLVRIRRQGRTIYYSANHLAIAEAIDGLMKLTVGAELPGQVPARHAEGAAAAPLL